MTYSISVKVGANLIFHYLEVHELGWPGKIFFVLVAVKFFLTQNAHELGCPTLLLLPLE